MVDQSQAMALLDRATPLPPGRIPTLLSAWKARWRERDYRVEAVEDVVAGDFSVFDPDEKEIENRSVNMVQVGIEDMAEAAALLPSIRVVPHKPTQDVRKKASSMEKMAHNYLELSSHELLVNETLLDMVGRGYATWTVLPYENEGIVRIERRDASHVYPEPGWKPGEKLRRAILARNVYATMLPTAWRNELLGDKHADVIDHNTTITLIEYFDDRRYSIYGLYETHQGNIGPYHSDRQASPANASPHLLDHWAHELGYCPLVYEQRITFDGEPRGQFDQTLGMQKAHVELWGMIMDYADQAVYSDMWVRDLIGEMSFGGGSYIELGPNGAVGRVPPAVSSLNAIDNLQRLEDSIHLGGRWPASRPGEIDQSIASAKFLEASAGMMNTAIRTLHMLLGRMHERALRMCFDQDAKFFPGKKTMAGTLRSQEFVEEYDTKDIELKNRVKVDYGIGFGREPSQSAVLAIQYNQLELVSDRTVQENIDGLNDIEGERARVDTQKFADIAMARLVQGLQDGTIPERALVEIERARSNQESVMDLYEKYVVEPAEEAAAGMIQGGLGPIAPGLPALPGGPAGALGPGGGAGGPGGPGGPPVPSPPLPAELLGRINAPAGPGGVIGTQVQGAPS